jgi:hypothetical protein
VQNLQCLTRTAAGGFGEDLSGFRDFGSSHQAILRGARRHCGPPVDDEPVSPR